MQGLGRGPYLVRGQRPQIGEDEAHVAGDAGARVGRTSPDRVRAVLAEVGKQHARFRDLLAPAGWVVQQPGLDEQVTAVDVMNIPEQVRGRVIGGCRGGDGLLLSNPWWAGHVDL